MTEIFTVGHSTQTYEQFLLLLRAHGISAIADVRSSPWSRLVPHFNRDDLSAALKADGIAYTFLGKELGGRPKDLGLYRHGVADYEAMAHAPSFLEGLNRVDRGAREFRIALMCSEKSPLECHRCLLVGRALFEKGYQVANILGDAKLILQSQIEEYLLSAVGTSSGDLFKSEEQRLQEAYRAQALKVAFRLADNTDLYQAPRMDDQ